MSHVLITGAGRGLGLELARQYAEAGWTVTGTLRKTTASSALRRLSEKIDVQLCDVSDRTSISQMAHALTGVPIDVLICCAGVYGPRDQRFGQTDYAAWEEVLRVNLFGPVALAEALSTNVEAGDIKRIVMVSSLMGSISLNDDGRDYGYRTSKAALNQAVKSLAAVLANRGITVIAISPGWVRTDMGGAHAPLSVEQSVSGMRKVIARLTLESTGRFFRYDGSELPW